jgi:hypothetical protein
MTDKVNDTLDEREDNYGNYDGVAKISQELKNVMHPYYHKLNNSQRESADMFANKLGRILNGNPNYPDSWLDIAGYAMLVYNKLEKK